MSIIYKHVSANSYYDVYTSTVFFCILCLAVVSLLMLPWMSLPSRSHQQLNQPCMLTSGKLQQTRIIHKKTTHYNHASCMNFQPIFCRTSSFYNSFYPSAIKIWNSLPTPFKSLNSLSLLKLRLKSHTF